MQPPMANEGLLRFFQTDLPAGNMNAHIQHVLDRIDGTYAASNPSIVQRMHGRDTARMLRAPVCLLEKKKPAFTSTFLSLVQGPLCTSSGGGEQDWSQPSGDRIFPVAVFDTEIAFVSFSEVHATQSIPWALDEKDFASEFKTEYRVFYLNELQKLTCLLLLLHTKEMREMFKQEDSMPLKKKIDAQEVDPSWLDDPNRILLSARMQLRSFTRWLCVGKEQVNSVAPMLHEDAYLPVCEDNNVLTTHFGRIFDSVLSIEIVHFWINKFKHADFATAAKAYVKGQHIGAERIHHAATVVLYVFYRFALWTAQAHPENAGVNIVCSFPAFIRMAVRTLFTSTAQWMAQLPLELQRVEHVFREMKDVFHTGAFRVTRHSCFFKCVQRSEWKQARKGLAPVSEERFMTGLMQIAHVLAELPKLNEKEVNLYDFSKAKCRYTPLRMLTTGEVERMSANAMRVVESVPHCGVLIEACNATCVRTVTVSINSRFFMFDLWCCIQANFLLFCDSFFLGCGTRRSEFFPC